MSEEVVEEGSREGGAETGEYEGKVGVEEEEVGEEGGGRVEGCEGGRGEGAGEEEAGGFFEGLEEDAGDQ